MRGLDCVSSNRMSTESTQAIGINQSTTTLNVPTGDVELQQPRVTRGRSWWWNVAFDLPLLLVVLIPLSLFEFGVIPTNKAGFYCNDPKLSFPFRGDTVSMSTIMIAILLFPFVTVFATEFILLEYTSLAARAKAALRVAGVLYRNYAFGLFFNLGIIEVMKGLTGSPRPTFFDICEPDAGRTCNGSEYVSEFKCTSSRYSEWFQSDSYHSFPSGHTSLSVLCGLFIAWYIQQRTFGWRQRSVLVAPVLQLLALAFSAACSLTRITDHRHHWWDVLMGAVVGTATAYYAVMLTRRYVSKLSRKSDTEDKASLTTVA